MMSESENVTKVEKPCDRCGRPSVIEVGEVRLCEECYQLPGSCCLEFGGDDLWDAPAEKEQE